MASSEVSHGTFPRRPVVRGRGLRITLFPRTIAFVFPSALAGVFLLAACSAQAPVEQAETIRIDASLPSSAPTAANYRLDSNVAPGGSTLNLNSRYLTLDGKPWLPVMGEFHFSRYPREQWEEELLKMKAAGVNIISTYVIWIHHEEIEGQFDWSGRRDLRAFALLCARNGLLLEPRIGPWAHAEARNGGLPDWVVKRGETRRNDPVYLAEVGRWYAEIGRQLHGLLWKDGGPIVAIQLENEYSQRGPGAGEEHILTLKKMAIASGFDVPYYFVTGWDNAVVPKPDVIPVYGGGYPDAPWDRSIDRLPPSEVYAFRFHSRVNANSENRRGSAGDEDVPYLTAEIGGGIEDTYHRRPVIHPDDIGAMFPVMLGSGVNLYGTYMFHGGENPDGQLSTLQESQATGYPNDLPIKSYDFQAPIGEFGQERASLGKMRLYQTFLNDFGSLLAPMAVHPPEKLPKNSADLSVIRASVRSNGSAGFLFCNNYVRNYSMPAHPSAQFEVHLPEGTLRIPARPIAIPSGAYFIWPFHLPLDGVELRYSTAQLFTRIRGSNGETFYFAAVRGIAPEFAFSASALRSVRTSSGIVHTESGVISVSGIAPGVNAQIELTARSGNRIHLVVLSPEDADRAWKVKLDGVERLLITNSDVFVAGDGSLRLRSRGDHQFAFTLLPAPAHAPRASLPLKQTAAGLLGVQYQAGEPGSLLEADLKLLAPPGDAPSVHPGPPNGQPAGVAQAPSETGLPGAGKWSIALPSVAAGDLSNLFLDIRYTGDVARLYSGETLLTDDFSNGLDWMIGLRHFVRLDQPHTLELSVLPLRRDAPVYFERPRRCDFAGDGQAARLESVKLVPEYELSLGTPSPGN